VGVDLSAMPKPARAAGGITIGVTELAWIFDRSRDWAAKFLEDWEDEQQNGGPVRVFRRGRCLYTTLPVLHQWMPPGRDLALYRRVEKVEGDVAEAHRRLDRQVVEIGEVKRRVTTLELRNRLAGAR